MYKVAGKTFSVLLTLAMVLSVFAFAPTSEQVAYAASAKVTVTFQSQGGSSVAARSIELGNKAGALKNQQTRTLYSRAGTQDPQVALR